LEEELALRGRWCWKMKETSTYLYKKYTCIISRYNFIMFISSAIISLSLVLGPTSTFDEYEEQILYIEIEKDLKPHVY